MRKPINHTPKDTKKNIADIRNMARQEVIEKGYEIRREERQGWNFAVETIHDKDGKEVDRKLVPFDKKPVPTRGKSEVETVMADEVYKCQKQIAAYFADLHDDLQKILVAVGQIRERVR